jgi:hypothetical protein
MAGYTNNYGSDQYPEYSVKPLADSTYGTQGSMRAVANQQIQPTTGGNGGAAGDPYTNFKNSAIRWGSQRKVQPQPTASATSVPQPSPSAGTFNYGDVQNLASKLAPAAAPAPSFNAPPTTGTPTGPTDLAAIMGGGLSVSGSNINSTTGGAKTPYTGDPNAPNTALALSGQGGEQTPGDRGDRIDRPVTPPGTQPPPVPPPSNVAPPPATPPPSTTPPPATQPPPGGKPRTVTKPGGDGTQAGADYDKLVATLPWLAQRPDLRDAFLNFSQAHPGVDPVDWLVGTQREFTAAHGDLRGLYKRSGRDTYFTDAQGNTQPYLIGPSGQTPTADEMADPMKAASSYIQNAPGFYTKSAAQDVKGVADTINTYRSDPQGLNYTDWMRIFHPDMLDFSGYGAQNAGSYLNRSDPSAIAAAEQKKAGGYVPGTAPSQTAGNKDTTLPSGAPAGTVPGSPADVAPKTTTPPVTGPPTQPPPVGDPRQVIAPNGPPPTQPPPAVVDHPPGTNTQPPVVGDPRQVNPNVTPPSGISPQGDISQQIHTMLDPLFRQKQTDLARALRSEGALTGDVNSGGFATSLARGEADLSAQQSNTEGQLLASASQQQKSLDTQQKIAELQANTSIANTKTQTGMQQFIAELNDQTQRLGIQTNADLQKALQGNQLLYQYSALDKNDILERYKADLAAKGQKYVADAQLNAASLQAATQGAAIAAQAAASQRAAEIQLQLGLGQQNVDWGNIQANLYQGDQNRAIQWAQIASQMGLTPAQLAQILGQFAPNAPVLTIPGGR